MGNVQSSAEQHETLSAMNTQVEKLFGAFERFQGMMPAHILDQCGPETAALLGDEVAMYTKFSDMVDRFRGQEDARYNGLRESGAQQLADLRDLYREALVQFVIAAETGLTLFPVVANNLIDTTEMLDVHITRMQHSLQLLNEAVATSARGIATQNQAVMREVRGKIDDLVTTNESVKDRIEDSRRELDAAISDVTAG
jgi:hypothetical protein